MTKEKLTAILEAHKAWLNNEPGGNRADLSWANLSWANLVEECGALRPLPASPEEANTP